MLAAGARRARVVTAVGLQGRHDPSLTYIRQLHAEGWFGQIVAVNAAMMGGGTLAHSSADAWMGVKANGANFMTIVGGHTIDAISYCLDAFTEGINFAHIMDQQQLPAQQIDNILDFRIAVTVSMNGNKNAIHITVVIHHDRCAGPRW